MQLTASNPQFAYAPVMNPTFAGGGMANAAKAIQSQGRGNDSMLVHMTPSEVKGLQALAMAHGGNLTVNPSTGLPEAGFLESVLPTVLGIGLNFLFPGSGMLIGAGIGALETARTGDLGKGIMAGLGAYGGANIGQALTSMGSQAAAASALPTAGSTATGVAPATESLLAQSISAPQMSSAPGVGSSLLQSTGAAPMSQATVSALQDQATQQFGQQGMFSQLGQGVQAAAADPMKFGSTLYGQMGKYGTMAAAAPAAMALSESLAPKPLELAKPEESKYEGPYYPFERQVRFKSPEDKSTSEFEYFSPSNPIPGYRKYYAAKGGLTALAKGGLPLEDGSFVVDARTVSEIGNGSSNAGLERLSKMGAKPIQGPGDGTSDSIRANIGGVQEARVARDEAVFPAEAVKRIGRGNPKAGAKKLYSLMDKAHAARKKAKRGQDTGLAALMA